MKKLQFLKKKTNALKIRLKPTRSNRNANNRR